MVLKALFLLRVPEGALESRMPSASGTEQSSATAPTEPWEDVGLGNSEHLKVPGTFSFLPGWAAAW